MSVFKYKRLGEIDVDGRKHFSYINKDALNRYGERVKNNNVYFFGVYDSDGKRSGSTLAQVIMCGDKKRLVCLETGGKGVSVHKHYLSMYFEIALKLKCHEFVIGTSRKGMAEIAQAAGMEICYQEFKINVE